MKQYKDLNLKKIADECELDFAHFTYLRGQCSCCYGPLDLPARYWRGGKKPVEVTDIQSPSGGRASHYELDGERFDQGKYSYILFKNANNGSGTVKKTDVIKDYTCVGHRFRDAEQKRKVSQMLLDQLDEDYCLAVPKSKHHTLVILTVPERREKDADYDYFRFGETVVVTPERDE